MRSPSVFALAFFVSLCRNLHADPVCLARSVARSHPFAVSILAPLLQATSQPASEGFSVYPSNFGLSVSPPSEFRPSIALSLLPFAPTATRVVVASLPDVLLAQPSSQGSPGKLVFIMRAHDRFEHVLSKRLFLRSSKSSSSAALSHELCGLEVNVPEWRSSKFTQL